MLPAEIECPLCKSKLIVGWNGQLYPDDVNVKTISQHWRRHTLSEIITFLEEGMLEQLYEKHQAAER